MDNKTEEKFYTFPQDSEEKLKFSGAEPKGGNVKTSSTGKVSIAIHNGDWCITKEENETEVTVEEYTGECSLEPTLVYTPEECFEFDSETGTITRYVKENNICGVEVIIPETINGVPVKSIGEYAFLETAQSCHWRKQEDTIKITKVVFPSGLENIGNYAFLGSEYTCLDGDCFTCYNNEIMELDFSRAKNLKKIGGYALSNNKLTSIEIPNSVTSIGNAAFASNRLISVTIKGKNSSSDFESYPNSTPFGWASGYSDSNIIWNG